MFVPSDKLKALVKLFPNKSVLCEKTGISETVLSLVMSDEREPSKDFMEAFLNYTGWPLDDLFKVEND